VPRLVLDGRDSEEERRVCLAVFGQRVGAGGGFVGELHVEVGDVLAVVNAVGFDEEHWSVSRLWGSAPVDVLLCSRAA
jgi:hypothetical protein